VSKKLKSLIACLLCAIMMVVSCGMASAAGGGASVLVALDGTPKPDIPVRMYRVADLDGKWVDAFAGYSLSFDMASEKKVSAMAATLQSLVIRDGIRPDYEFKTGSDGRAAITDGAPGIWLVMTDDYTSGRTTYHSQASLFSLYQGDKLDIEMKYTVTTKPEGGGTPTPGKDPVMKKVLKVWKDRNHPDSVKMTLLRNGKAYQTVVLNDDNGWRYTWSDLDADYSYAIIEEDVPDGYVVNVQIDGITTVVTNMRKPVDPPDDPPDDPPERPEPPVDKPHRPSKLPVDPPETPSEPPVITPEAPVEPPVTLPQEPEVPVVEPETPVTPESVDESPVVTPEDPAPATPKLPQTGHTWFEVMVLGIFGICLVLFAYIVDDPKKTGVHGIGCTILLIAGLFMIIAAGVLTGIFITEEKAANDNVAAVSTLTQEYISDVQSFYEGYDVPGDYEFDDTRGMPVVNINGTDIIGQVRIDSLGLDLSVANSWDTQAAKKTPCRYTGSAYQGDMIICGHNYKSHFGELSTLEAGDDVVFTDMDGNVFDYQVTEIETLSGTAVDEINEGEWDLTLFTCTPGGKNRVVVRCTEVTP